MKGEEEGERGGRGLRSENKLEVLLETALSTKAHYSVCKLLMQPGCYILAIFMNAYSCT